MYVIQYNKFINKSSITYECDFDVCYAIPSLIG